MKLSKYLTLVEALKELEDEKELYISNDTYPNREYRGNNVDSHIVALELAIEKLKRIYAYFGEENLPINQDYLSCVWLGNYPVERQTIMELKGIIREHTNNKSYHYSSCFENLPKERRVEALLMGLKVIYISCIYHV